MRVKPSGHPLILDKFVKATHIRSSSAKSSDLFVKQSLARFEITFPYAGREVLQPFDNARLDCHNLVKTRVSWGAVTGYYLHSTAVLLFINENEYGVG